MKPWQRVKLGPFFYSGVPGEIVSPARWHGCPSYNDCLKKAGREAWPSFTCKGCDMMPRRGSEDWTVDDSGAKVSLIVFEHENLSDGSALPEDHPEHPGPEPALPDRVTERVYKKRKKRKKRRKG